MAVQAPPQRLATGRAERAERQAKRAGAAAQRRQRRLDRERIGDHAPQGAAEREEPGVTPARLGQVAATEGVEGPPADVPSALPDRPGLANQAWPGGTGPEVTEMPKIRAPGPARPASRPD
jgi:hypothetical protein